MRQRNDIPTQPETFINIPAEEVKVRYAACTDASSIVELTLATYGKSYARREFYDADKIAWLITEGYVQIGLAVWKDKIVSMGGLIRRSDYLYESGLAMTPPIYSHSTAIFKIYTYIMEQFHRECSEALLFADCVTSHVRSQALLRYWIACSISFSAYHKPNFSGIKVEGTQRESLLYLVEPFIKQSHWTLYAPSEHVELLSGIITQLGGTADISPLKGDTPDAGHTTFTQRIEHEKDAGACDFSLDTCGKDFNEQLKCLTNDAVKHGALAISIAVNLSKGMPERICEDFHRAGYFFTGFLPTIDHSWEMVYQYIIPGTIDFTKINILAPKNKTLLTYIQKDKEVAEKLTLQ